MIGRQKALYQDSGLLRGSSGPVIGGFEVEDGAGRCLLLPNGVKSSLNDCFR